MDSSDLTAAGSALLALVAIVVSLFVARSQNSLARREQLFPVVGELLSEFRASEFKRRLVYIETQLSLDCPPDTRGSYTMTHSAFETIRPAMSYFNNIGLLVFHKTVAPETVSSLMGGSIVNAWQVLAPYIYSERHRRGDDPNYYGYFEHLAVVVRELGPSG